MPELPEVETLCRQLRQRMIDEIIEEVRILDSKLGALDDLKGRRIVSVERQGKRILLKLNDGMALSLHLRMTGRLIWHERDAQLPRHSRFILDVTSGRAVLVDPRRFATLTIVTDEGQEDRVIDALSPGCAEVLMEKGRNRTRSLKSFLMDQNIVGGIGNIYACEILYEAGLHPRHRTSELSPGDWRRVEKAMGDVLLKAVACRGTSISDWRDFFDRKGECQNELRVYSREGEKCLRCGGVIQRERFLGRGTWFCPDCQV